MSIQLEGFRTTLSNLSQRIGLGRNESVVPFNWCKQRDNIILNGRPPGLPANATIRGGKWMDVETTPDDPVAQAEWDAYVTMMKKKIRRYMSNQIEKDASFSLSHIEPRSPENPIIYGGLGCGSGDHDRKLIDMLFERGDSSVCFLVDRSAAALRRAFTKFQTEDGFQLAEDMEVGEINAPALIRTNGDSYQKVVFIKADITNLDGKIPDDFFDFLLKINVDHHLTSDEVVQSYREMDRTLKAGSEYIVLDTGKLPEDPRQKVMQTAIKKAVSVEAIGSSMEKEGKEFGEIARQGAERFVYDAQRAFVQALTLKELEELIQESGLGPNSRISSKILRHPNPFIGYIAFPPMNYLTGTKNKSISKPLFTDPPKAT